MSSKQEDESAKQALMNAQEVIEKTISNNQRVQWMVIWLSIVYIVAMSVVAWWDWANKIFVVIAGMTSSILLWLALMAVRSTRKENFSLRLLEIMLSMEGSEEKTADEIHKMLKATLAEIHKNGRG